MNGIIKVMGYDIPISILDKYLTIYTSGFSMAYLSVGGKGSVVRQVMKYLKNVGEIYFDKLWIRTENYSGGNSIRCYVVGEDEKSGQKMKEIMSLFEMGSFNGMEDIYEYKMVKLQVEMDNGLLVECSTKYNQLYDKQPYDVKPYEVVK